ncbi:hypothetical protein NKH45_25240 [Mesorhizobium sp. M1156]|uniref:hypothetical protein n=1 Tax=Mesorhizobium sp. M1156 TaxID=2957064 RepID=UPI00333CDA47
MAIKYFYVEDDTAVLFAANGTALTALLVGLKDIVPAITFPIPTFPIWLYLLGLIFAFLSKAMIQLINGDTLQRERLQNARDLLIAALKEPDLTEDISAQLDATWRWTEAEYMKLINLPNAPRIAKLRALFFFLSALCFLIATSVLIHLAGFLTTPQL